MALDWETTSRLGVGRRRREGRARYDVRIVGVVSTRAEMNVDGTVSLERNDSI